MSTQLKPIEIPPGVSSTATKKMRSTNWSEVNLIRWREGQLMPMGGQSQLTYSAVPNGPNQYVFASKCRRIHGWYDVNGVYHIAYLCEQHLYIDTGGILSDVTPAGGMAGPSGVQGGYGDGVYQIPPGGAVDNYGTPRTISIAVAITKIPDAYSLDNFGGVLYAMTSADGRLLKWDAAAGVAAIGGVTAVSAFTTSSPIIYTTTIPALVVAGLPVIDVTLGQQLGTVASVVANNPTGTAIGLFTTSMSAILITSAPAGVGAGMTVADLTTGNPVGAVAGHSLVNNTLTAAGAFTASYKACFMPVKPAWVALGMTLTDTTNSAALGVLQFYGVYNVTLYLTAGINAGDTTLHMQAANNGQVIPGMDISIYDNNTGLTTLFGQVVSYVGTNLVISAPAPISIAAPEANLSSGVRHIASWSTAAASSGAADVIRFNSGVQEVLQLTGNCQSNSSGSTDTLQYSGGSKLTLNANSLFASSGLSDVLQFGGNKSAVQAPDAGRGVVPNGRCFVVTQERFIMIFGSKNDGTSDPAAKIGRRFAWCDQENPGAWDYSSVTSMAGFLDVEPGSPIICATTMKNGTVFWTAKRTYASRFLGMPYIYNYTEIGDSSTPWSPQSTVNTSPMLLWMSEKGPFSYDGTSILPLKMPIRPWVDDDIDPVAVREISFAAHLAEFNEWWWFYPTLNSPFNTRAAVYNYKEGWWTQVRMSRSAGMTSSYTSHPYFADDFVVFQHEIYKAAGYANASMPVVLPFAETYDLNLASGSRLTTIKQLIPDIESVDEDDPQAIINAIKNLRYSIFYRNSRTLGSPEVQSPQAMVRDNGYVDFRVTGRDVRLRIDVGPVIQPFTIGQHLIDAVPRGDR